MVTVKLNLSLKVKVNHPQNNNDLNQDALHPRPKFGDPSFSFKVERTRSYSTGKLKIGRICILR